MCKTWENLPEWRRREGFGGFPSNRVRTRNPRGFNSRLFLFTIQCCFLFPSHSAQIFPTCRTAIFQRRERAALRENERNRDEEERNEPKTPERANRGLVRFLIHSLLRKRLLKLTPLALKNNLILRCKSRPK